jgi:hypothetical protein
MRKLSKKGGLISLFAAAVFVVASIGSVGGAAAAEDGVATPLINGCEGGHVCVYEQTNFGLRDGFFVCSTGIQSAFGESAINACGERPVWLLKGNAQQGWQQFVCMEPGGERPSPGTFYGVEILNLGEHC